MPPPLLLRRRLLHRPASGPAYALKAANFDGTAPAGSEPYLKVASTPPPAALVLGQNVACGAGTWVKLHSKTRTQALMGVWTNGTASNEAWVLRYNNVNDRFQILVRSTFGNFQTVNDSHLGSPALETWYFVSWGYDTANLSLRINAFAADSAAWAQGIDQNASAEFRLGIENSLTDRLDGALDEAFVYKNRAVDATLHARLYNTGVGLSSADLTAADKTNLSVYYDLDDASAAVTWIDAMGVANLTRVNGVTSVAGVR